MFRKVRVEAAIHMEIRMQADVDDQFCHPMDRSFHILCLLINNNNNSNTLCYLKILKRYKPPDLPFQKSDSEMLKEFIQ